MNRRIRELGPKDYPSILRINRESAPGVFELDDTELSSLHELCEYSKVIEIDGETAGYILALGKGLHYDGEEYGWFCENLEADFLYIDQVAIGEQWKRKGCGKELYRDLEKFARRNFKSALVCEVNREPLNRDSMIFHAKSGFEELSRMTARGMVVSLMAKRVVPRNA